MTVADSRDVVALLYRALAEHGRGHADAARAALQQAERQLAASDAGRLAWDQRFEAERLLAEAKASPPPAGP